MQANLGRYVVQVDNDRQVGFGDELDDAIAWALDASAVGKSVVVWTCPADSRVPRRRVWPHPEP